MAKIKFSYSLDVSKYIVDHLHPDSAFIEVEECGIDKVREDLMEIIPEDDFNIKIKFSSFTNEDNVYMAQAIYTVTITGEEDIMEAIREELEEGGFEVL